MSVVLKKTSLFRGMALSLMRAINNSNGDMVEIEMTMIPFRVMLGYNSKLLEEFYEYIHPFICEVAHAANENEREELFTRKIEELIVWDSLYYGR